MQLEKMAEKYFQELQIIKKKKKKDCHIDIQKYL